MLDTEPSGEIAKLPYDTTVGGPHVLTDLPAEDQHEPSLGPSKSVLVVGRSRDRSPTSAPSRTGQTRSVPASLPPICPTDGREGWWTTCSRRGRAACLCGSCCVVRASSPDSLWRPLSRPSWRACALCVD